MTLCANRTELLQRAGRDVATKLLPAPFSLWYSDHSTGCQMTIVAKDLVVWQGSIWYSGIYEFNDRDKIGGLQPDFAFAKDVIEKYFADVSAKVEEADRLRAERATVQKAETEAKKLAALDEVRRQVNAA